MALNYKKELEIAAKNMILVHDPNTLIRMIIRLMVQKVKVPHAGIILYDDRQEKYILRVTRSSNEKKTYHNSTHIHNSNPLIRFFLEKKDREIFGDGLIIYREAKQALKRELDQKTKEILIGALYQMEVLDAVVCIPSYFRNYLMGILFLGKKVDGNSFYRRELDFFVNIASDVAMAIRNAQLFRHLQDELNKSHRIILNTAISVAAAIEAKDHYTLGHTQRVTDLSLKIGKKLIDEKDLHLGSKFLEHLHIAALFHDIGKIHVPEAILNKAAALTSKERFKLQMHPVSGAEMLRPIAELEPAIQGVKYHHERYDGAGYPEGLCDDKIPMIAAVIAVADTFDAITSNRPYRNSMDREQAVNEIQRVSGLQLHPKVVSSFIKVYREGKI